jgi:hypothetical protein
LKIIQGNADPAIQDDDELEPAKYNAPVDVHVG